MMKCLVKSVVHIRVSAACDKNKFCLILLFSMYTAHHNPGVPPGRLCGSLRMPRYLVSHGSRLLVTYVTSQNQNGHKGFKAHYEGER